MTSIAIVAAVISLLASAVWDTSPRITCSSDATLACYPGDRACSTEGEKAIWEVDFGKGLITELGSGRRQKIIARNRDFYLPDHSGDTVYTEHGRVMRFWAGPFITGGNALPIKAMVAGPSSQLTAEVITFSCASTE